MSEENNNKPIRNDEIDLLELFSRMGKTIRGWMNSAGRAILIIIVFMIRKWIPLSISIILSLILAFFAEKKGEEMFSSEMILKNNTVSNSEMIEYIDRLHIYFQQGNYFELSKILMMPEDSINKIYDIEAFWIICHKRERIPLYTDYDKKFTVADTAHVRMQDRMAIRLITKSKVSLEEIRNGIITFINSDSLLKQKNRLRLRQNMELLDRLNIDIAELDSLQKLKYFEDTKNTQSQKATQMIFLQQQNTQLVYSDIYGLFARRQALETERDLYYDLVTILSDFSLPESKKMVSIMTGKNIVITIFLITLTVLALLSNRKKLIEIYNKY